MAEVSTSIPLAQLRQVTGDILNALTQVPSLRALDELQGPMVQAYLLGVLMQGTGIDIAALDTGLKSMVIRGMQDYRWLQSREPDDSKQEDR